MKKLDNFSNCLRILKNADFMRGHNDEIYRTGIVGQFNLTFELAWKALQQVLRVHGVFEAETGSPREILQLAYKIGFLEDDATWLIMLNQRNRSVYIYNEEEINALLVLIRDEFVPAFAFLEKTLQEKMAGIEDDGD